MTWLQQVAESPKKILGTEAIETDPNSDEIFALVELKGKAYCRWIPSDGTATLSLKSSEYAGTQVSGNPMGYRIEANTEIGLLTGSFAYATPSGGTISVLYVGDETEV